ncbi:MAG: hypothetical protein JNK67_24075 [Alphaproteobacteria bacterium]|nr:hypothetical protein [Alphaproteobacteria bacterium]
MPSVIHAIPVVTPEATGVHLLWSGPREWLYSPGGWRLQRRELDRRREVECVNIAGATLAGLRAARERRTAIGMALLRAGAWPGGPDPGTPEAGAAAEVFTLELDRPAPFVRVVSTAKWNFVVALRAGKVVGGGRAAKAPFSAEFAAPGIDTIVAYTLGMGELTLCRGRDASEESWREAPVIARLQLPLREAMPELGGIAAELALARSRLLPGETLREDEFRDVADLLRRLVRADGPPRPIDLALLMRDSTSDAFTELAALDPLRSLLLVPRWRRALGFAHFDRGPGLVPGQAYEYRLTGAFPAADLGDRVAGFHTVPSTTALPADFQLGTLRIRLAQPGTVTLARAPAANVLRATTRRGVALRLPGERFWLGLDLDRDSAVIDFPTPVSAVVLELGGAHTLSFAAGDPAAAFGPYAPVPAGQLPRLAFPSPVMQLRLRGRGFLCAVRIGGGGGSGLIEEAVATAPVTLAHTPPPVAPLALDIANLQVPQSIALSDRPSGPTPPPQALGFALSWTPAPVAGTTTWPADLGAAPPLEATMFQIEHQPLEPAGAPWVAVLEDDNLVSGDRALPAEPTRIVPGVDLMQVFPEARLAETAATAMRLQWRDVFDFAAGDAPVRRPLPPTGSRHRYRIRAVDAIGRPSADARESAALRLEKRVPPPMPAGIDPRPAHALSRAAPSGPQVRILVRDAPDLSAEERAILGGHDNAILLSWGWHAEQRAQDPSAREFRVYVSRHRLDAQLARVDAVAELGPGRYAVDLHLERDVPADASAGLVFNAGYPFHLRSHGAGRVIQAVVAARVARPDGSFPSPRLGDAKFPMRLTPDMTRAGTWSARTQVVPLVAGRDVYAAAPIFDLLDLGPDHPRDEVMVGVSAADAEPYVDDPLAPAESRPGNEGAIAAVRCAARYRGRPIVADVPALAPVPEIVAPFPGARPLGFRLDLSAILAGSGFAAGARAVPERALVDDVVAAYRIEAGRVVARVLEPRGAGDAESEVTVPNPLDRAAIIAAIEARSVDGLADAHAVFLAASHPFRARLFTPAAAATITLPAFDESLANRAGRWIYRLRAIDNAGRTSLDGVTLKGVVRVPAATPVTAPIRLPARAGDPRHRLRLAVHADDVVTHVMVFSHEHAAATRAPVTAELMSRALPAAPGAVLARLRLPDGTMLTPTLRSLADPGVEGAPPYRALAVDAAAGGDDRVSLWACAVTRDGWLSPLVGPWTL